MTKKIVFLLTFTAFFVLGVSVVAACRPQCEGDCMIVESPEPSPTLTASPSATPATQVNEKVGAPQAPECKKIEHTPQIAWYMQKTNGVEFIWSAVEEPYVNMYLVEYKVNDVIYNVFVQGTNADINASGTVTDVRVAATHEGCVGPFSNWRHQNVEVGFK